MAITANISICQSNNCGNLVITDISTGITDFTTVTDVVISITNYDIDNVAEFPVWERTYNTLAITSQDELVFTITESIADNDGNKLSLSDGHIDVTYTITDGTGTDSVSQGRFLYCNAQCCVDTMKPKMYDYYNCNPCDDSYIDLVLTLDALLLGLQANAGCGNYTEAYKVLLKLQEVCDYTDCECSK